MNIAVVFNNIKSEDYDSVRNIIDFLKSLNACVLMEERCSNIFDKLKVNFLDFDKLMQLSDVVVALGGDGTIMHIAKEASRFNKPVMGINMGRLGFMACLEKHQINKLSCLVNGEYNISKRMMLDIKNGETSLCALNDISIIRDISSQISDYRIYRGSNKICGYRADGVIVATPTGSTAYSLSAGGPIVEADMNCLIVTPICAHSLSARSVVLDPNIPVIVEYALKEDSRVVVSVDGKICFSDNSKGTLEIKKSKSYTQFVVLNNNNFYNNIDKKFINKINL